MEIIKQWLLKTGHGLNLLIYADDGNYYWQNHRSLENSGAGALVWNIIPESVASELLKASGKAEHHFDISLKKGE